MSNEKSITGRDIKNAIKGGGYTMEEAAEKLGMTRQTLHNYLGRAKIDNEFIQNVKTALQIEIQGSDSKLPETYGELLEVYRIAVKQMEARILNQDRLIALLEEKLARRH